MWVTLCVCETFLWCVLSQELENQALAEAEAWREQQGEVEEQQALQARARQEVEAEVERYKQVRGDLCPTADMTST